MSGYSKYSQSERMILHQLDDLMIKRRRLLDMVNNLYLQKCELVKLLNGKYKPRPKRRYMLV